MSLCEPLLSLCVPMLEHMWGLCGAYVEPMWGLCGPMWSLCGAYVVPMWDLCCLCPFVWSRHRLRCGPMQMHIGAMSADVLLGGADIGSHVG